MTNAAAAFCILEGCATCACTRNPPAPMHSDAYQARLTAEKAIYKHCTDVHKLPAAFHYWSNRYVRPKLNSFGLDSPNELFFQYLESQCSQLDRHAYFVSLGAGNCDLEIEAACYLRSKGFERFTLECLELNDAMLERGQQAAFDAEVAAHLTLSPCDLNRWTPTRTYDAVIANQSLHHLLALEELFSHIEQSLAPRGSLIMSDMIGRNGHQRWPEALSIVQEFWRQLPPSYRFNTLIQRYEEKFEDWDCSVEGLEGIRSEDILPLLVDRFHFRFFLGFANLIDPFTDRAFGPHFERLTGWDRSFLDCVQARDEQELACGQIKPTHMLAVACIDPNVSPILDGTRSPRFSLRPPSLILPPSPPSRAQSPYDVAAWPKELAQEVILAVETRKLVEAQEKERTAALIHEQKLLEDRTAWARRLEEQMEERTAWAQTLDARVSDLERQLEERTAWGKSLERELDERTRTLLARTDALHTEVGNRTMWAKRLEGELADRTRWALQLRDELNQQSARASLLEGELRGYLHNPFRFAVRLLRGMWNRSRRLFT